MKLAVVGTGLIGASVGLAARRAGRIPRRTHAEASTPEEGLPDLS